MTINVNENFHSSLFIDDYYKNNHNHLFRFYHLVNNLIDIFTLFMGQGKMMFSRNEKKIQ